MNEAVKQNWAPRLRESAGPRYLALVDALASAVGSGEIGPGTRLLPQREMAERIGVSVATVSKAYAEAARRGLVSGEVGRGTFVLGPGAPSAFAGTGHDRPVDGVINFSLNVPPDTGAGALLARTLREAAESPDFSGLLGYLPHQGLRGHRQHIARWMSASGLAVTPEQVLITQGAQHALAVALSAVAASGETVLAENVTYSGLLSLASMCDFRLSGLDMDADGVVPEHLDAEIARTGARVVMLMPTLQTPTGTVMPPARREEIARILRDRNCYLVEDDVHAFLCEPLPAPISSLIPERSFYFTSFAKALVPGVRIGALIVPEGFRERAVNAIRATGWMAAPVMAEAVVRLIEDGGLEAQAARKRELAGERVAIARAALPDYVAMPAGRASFHVWVEPPGDLGVSDIISRAGVGGIIIAAPGTIATSGTRSEGFRLCLGSPASNSSLRHGLSVIAEAFTFNNAMSVV